MAHMHRWWRADQRTAADGGRQQGSGASPPVNRAWSVSTAPLECRPAVAGLVDDVFAVAGAPRLGWRPLPRMLGALRDGLGRPVRRPRVRRAPAHFFFTPSFQISLAMFGCAAVVMMPMAVRTYRRSSNSCSMPAARSARAVKTPSALFSAVW